MTDDRVQQNALVVLESLAMTCRRNAVDLANGKSPEFTEGLRMAYLDVLSVLVEEAALHGVPLDAIGLAGYDPYSAPELM